MNILLTSVGCMGYIGLIKAFQESDCKVFGVDCSKDAVGFNFCDGFAIVSHADKEEYVGELLKVCEKHSIELLIACSDNEILKVGEHRAMFESLGVSVLLPSNNSLNICDNKRLFYERLSSWGLNHPTVRAPLDAEFPAILKPNVGKGSEGVRLINNISEIPDNSLPPKYSLLDEGYLLQDFIEGDEYTVDVLASKSSVVLSMVQRKRTRIESGISVAAEVVEDEEGKAICSQLNDRLLMCGMYCVQYIKNHSGVYILEVNPRFGGGSVLSLRADPTIILNYLNIAQDEPIEKLSNPKIMKMKRYYAEIYE
jgi:carbamoyl-phosphate synthase large subunit